MIRKIFIPALLLFLSVSPVFAQKPSVVVLTEGTKASLRGLSVVNDNVVWVSGSNGTVGRSTNGGKNWKWMTVKGFEKTEFRDIEAFDANTAIIMAIAEPAYILKTHDGGDTWKVVYENKTKGMFLDAMDFYSAKEGIVVGDPVNGRVFLASTEDGGDTWQEWESHRPAADSGEAFFAASGSNIRLYEDGRYILVSGGKRSRLFSNNGVIDLPLLQGKESTGANSLDVYEGVNKKPTKLMIVTGGDFSNDSLTDRNCFYTTDGGRSWKAPKEPPHGYRSCVEYLSKDDLLTCGLNGVDYSSNGGKSWRLIAKEGFHVCRIARLGTAIYLAGNNGKIGKLVWH